MHRILSGSADRFSDVKKFLDRLTALQKDAEEPFFDASRDIVVARAPGRLDVMGGIADYSGSLVLELPLEEATFAAIQVDSQADLQILSIREAGSEQTRFRMPLDAFESGCDPLSYSQARLYFQKDPANQWAAYVVGAYLVLMHEKKVRFDQGARILIDSSVPEGRGVSSSAALEVAALQSVVAGYELSLSPEEVAAYCQKVENLVVGAPCGIMDQMTAVFGVEDHLLAILCQPAELQGTIPIPEGLQIWGIDSGLRHQVCGADYATVRTAAFMGYRMIAERAGLTVHDRSGRPARVEDPLWNGYLANLEPSSFEADFKHDLPERVSGEEFLFRYGQTTDPVTQIQPVAIYPVRAATAHPIYENFRVHLFRTLLSRASEELDYKLLGELMYQSHASYSACDLGSAGTNLLVELVRGQGFARGLYGAKITGGGSGGTVAVLGRRGAEQVLQEVVRGYHQQTGYHPKVFSGSSSGAGSFGSLSVRID